MSNYTVATNFGAKDSLASGNPAKLILGAQLTTEFNNIATAIATKYDALSTNIVIPAPASGTALSATGIGGQYAAIFTAGNNGVALQALGNTTTSNSFGMVIQAGTNGTDYALKILNSAAAQMLLFNGSGNLTIAAPASGVTLSATNSGASVASIVADSTNANGALFYVTNSGTRFGAVGSNKSLASGSLGDLCIFGDNNINLQTAGNVSINGNPIYAGIPQNSQAGTTYTTALADANKHILMSNAAAKTLTLGASLYAIGTTITVFNDNTGNVTIATTGVSILWAANDTTGARTLAPAGLATLLLYAANAWVITGTGLT